MASPGSYERPSLLANPRGWARRHAHSAVGLVVAITVLGLALRFLLLGARIAHWDEARVGYWIVHYMESGSFAYRRIIHGPFVQHVNRWLFALVGANDYTMRVPVALIGGLLPLTALLFREHLRRIEIGAMALFLALNPVLLYYSRFMRSDLLVATFMFAAFGLFVRFYDTRRWRYVYGAAALMACGFASKENAIVYVATWVGATALLVDQALYRPREHDSGYHLLLAKAGALRQRIDEVRTADRVVAYAAHLVGAAVVFLALLLFFYAPRGAGVAGIQHPPAPVSEGVGLWQAVLNPAQFPGLVDATVDRTIEEFGRWIGGAGETGGDQSLIDEYVEYLGRFVRVMGTRAGALTAFAVFGFVLERYGSARSRNLVLFAGYCGFVSVLGYPLGTDIFGAWLTVHALVPLSVPAAVGLTRLVDWGREALAADDRVGVGAAALVFLLVLGQLAVVGTTAVYVNHQSDQNTLVQYAQPGDDPREELQTIREVAAADGSGPDVVLFYGEEGDRYSDGDALVVRDRSRWNDSYWNHQPTCSKWFNSLPLPWYFAASDADVACERSAANLTASSNPPPVIVTSATDDTVPRERLEQAYEGETYEMRSYGTEMTFWIHESQVE